jgi:MATE family multidrug resistance protein
LRTDDSSTLAELRALVALSWPIALAQVGLIAMALVETAVVGRVSTIDLAGAALGRSISFAAITIGMGLAEALEPLAAQAIGAGEPDRAWSGLRTTTQAVLFLWAPLMAVSFAATLALEPLGVSASVVSRCRDYQLGQAPGMALTLVFLASKTFLQAHGKTQPALLASGAANVVNLIICNLLVRGDEVLIACGLRPLGLPRLGALGAGFAYTLSSMVLAAVVLRATFSHRPTRFTPRLPFAPVLRLGVPVGLQMLAEIGVFTVATVLVGKFGAQALSAHQVALGLASFTYMGALGVSGATAVRVGHAVGQGRSPRRAGALGIALGAAFMGIGATLFALLPRALIRAFSQDSEVIGLGADLLVIAALFQLFDGVQTVAGGALRGAGDVRYSLFANLAGHWLIGFPLACLLGLVGGGGVRGIWWGLTAGLVSVAVLLSLRFAKISGRVIARV